MNSFEIIPNNSSNQKTLQFSLREGQITTSNFSIRNNQDKELKIEFFTQDAAIGQNQQLLFGGSNNALGSWTKISPREITLAPHETRGIPFTVEIPANAPRGEHHALILARPVLDTAQSEAGIKIIHQQGLHLITRVPGEQMAKISLVQEKQVPCGSDLCFQYDFKNYGTSPGEFTLDFSVQNREENLDTQSQKLSLGRDEKATAEFRWDTPLFGTYTVTTNVSKVGENTKINSLPQTREFTFFPIIELILGLTVALIIFKKLLKSPRKKLQYISIIATIVSFGLIGQYLFFPLGISNPNRSLAQEEENSFISTHYLTVQWGNVRQAILPQKEKFKKWNFSISIDEGELEVDSHLDFENADLTSLSPDKKTLEIISDTDNDVDGLIILVRNENSKTPVITFSDLLSRQRSQFTMSNLSKEQLFLHDRQSIHILASDMYYKAKRFYIYSREENLVSILDATEDLEAFLERPATPQIIVEEIEKIFALLPATYEATTEIRPEYDLISQIIAASAQVTVFADPIFISELAASPDLLYEIAASPSRNFTFIPNLKIVFPKQEFNFKEQKIISIPINELLFTHQKAGHWTTYVQTSDFVSTTNGNILSATNLCLIPGDIEWLGTQALNFLVNTKYCFKSSSDPMLLIERDTEAPANFKIRPTLELKIPEGTPPSVYQGVLTFTEV